MPELPEVETIRRVLRPHLQNRTIADVQIKNAQVIAAPAPEAFAAAIGGQTIRDVSRRGKFLRFILTDGILTLHLRMTGCLLLQPLPAPLPAHTHLVFSLDDGNALLYEDVRRFGRFHYAPAGERDESGAARLGPEPEDITAEELSRVCGKRKLRVKQMLLDQRVVAGIGNIYSDEIAFWAGVRPDRRCDSLTAEEWTRLADAIPERAEEWTRLADAIPERIAFFTQANAVTFEEYRAGGGKEYRNTPYLNVYGKAGAPCPKCGAPLTRLVLGGRSSVFCPHCQK